MAKKKKFDYFTAFSSQTKIAIREADLLIEALDKFSSADALEPFMKRAHDIENESDEITHRVFQNLASDFITPFDREDLASLAQALDDIIDYIDDVVLHMYMFDVHFMHENARDFAMLIKKSCEALDRAMDDFRNFKKSKKFKSLIVEVNDHEEEADTLLVKVIRSLHTKDRENPMRVIVWTQIFDRMERVCDACEHVADTMMTVILKNS